MAIKTVSMLGLVALIAGHTANVQAGELTQWEFQGQKSRLEIKLDEGTQPKVMVLHNPTRLVVDLPHVTGTGTESQTPSSPYIAGIRVSQFDKQTTRMVVELAPDYTWYTHRINIEGVTPHHWQVTLPEFIPLEDVRDADLKTQILNVPNPQLPKPKLK